MRLINYIKETKGELQYVKWPTKKQAMAFTAVVIVISILASIYLGFFDYLFLLILQKFVL